MSQSFVFGHDGNVTGENIKVVNSLDVFLSLVRSREFLLTVQAQVSDFQMHVLDVPDHNSSSTGRGLVVTLATRPVPTWEALY